MARSILSAEDDNTPMPGWFPIALIGGLIGTTLAGAWALSASEPIYTDANTHDLAPLEQVQVVQGPQANTPQHN